MGLNLPSRLRPRKSFTRIYMHTAARSRRLHIRGLPARRVSMRGWEYRLIALTLCFVFVFSIVLPPVTALAADVQAAGSGKLAGGLDTVTPAYAPAKNAATSPTGGLDDNTAAQAKTFKQEELPAKRTATSDVTRQTDGSLTTRQYATPKYFKQGNSWEKIDTTLVEDKNPADATNPVAKGFSALSTVFTSEKTFTVKQNGWQARFAPSNADKGMVRIKRGQQQMGFKPVGAKTVAPVITTSKQDGKQIVHYYDLWPGVNVDYVIYGDSVKENISIKNKAAATSFGFALVGATLEAGTDPAGPAYRI